MPRPFLARLAIVASIAMLAAPASASAPRPVERCTITWRADGELASACAGRVRSYQLGAHGPPRCSRRPAGCSIREIVVQVR